MWNSRPSNSFPRRERVTDDRYRAIRDSLVDELISICVLAAHRDEAPVSANPPAVVIEPGNGGIAPFV